MTDFLSFKDIHFTYPFISGEYDENGNPIPPKPVFDHFSATLPGGFTSLVGPNGCGKSTLMLLAAGRLCPQRGSIELFGKNTKDFFINQVLQAETGHTFTVQVANPEKELEKNALASFIYQNMEFETEDKVCSLLEQVLANGAYANKKDLFKEVITIFELEKILNHTLTGISKGEIQRVLLAFAILYGSKSIFMDEPLFALELKTQEKILDYLRSFSKDNQVPMYISMHELHLTKKYAENVLLIHPNRDMEFGTPAEVLTKESLEKAYGVPEAMLNDAELLKKKQILEDNLHHKE